MTKAEFIITLYEHPDHNAVGCGQCGGRVINVEDYDNWCPKCETDGTASRLLHDVMMKALGEQVPIGLGHLLWLSEVMAEMGAQEVWEEVDLCQYV